MSCNLLYITDENFIVQTATSISSFLINNKGISTIHIIDTGITKDSRDGILKLIQGYGSSVFFYSAKDVIQLLEKLDLKMPNETGNVSTLVRLFALDRLPKDIDRILYIDADTIVAGDLTELFSINFEEPIAAVVDANYDFYDRVILNMTGNKHYFNAGIMLINKEKYINELKKNDISTLISKNFPLADQDTLNYVFGDKCYLLKPIYNSTFKYRHSNKQLLEVWAGKKFTYSEADICESRHKPLIIHFTTSVLGRPWEKDCLDRDCSIWRHYCSLIGWENFKPIKRRRSIGTYIGRTAYIILPRRLFCKIDYWYAKRKYERRKSDE